MVIVVGCRKVGHTGLSLSESVTEGSEVEYKILRCILLNSLIDYSLEISQVRYNSYNGWFTKK